MKSQNATPELPRRVGTCLSFVQALSLGDLKAATACFAWDACLITPDATAIHGRDQIRPVLAQLIARQTEIRIEFSNVLSAGDVALACERWTIRSSGVEGSRFERTFDSVLILRRIEGQWKLVIAAPWGWVNRLEVV